MPYAVCKPLNETNQHIPKNETKISTWKVAKYQIRKVPARSSRRAQSRSRPGIRRPRLNRLGMPYAAFKPENETNQYIPKNKTKISTWKVAKYQIRKVQKPLQGFVDLEVAVLSLTRTRWVRPTPFVNPKTKPISIYLKMKQKSQLGKSQNTK